MKKLPLSNILIVIVAMSYMGFLGMQNFILAFEHGDWLEVEATIINAYLSSGRHNAVLPNVEYGYTVNGLNYVNERIDFGRLSSSEEEVRQLVKLYPEGKQVTIFYDPSDPSISTLSKKGNAFGGFIVMLFCWGIAAACIKYLYGR